MSMSDASIPVFEIGLNVLSALLDKAEAYAEAKRIDRTVLLGVSLFPGMVAFSRQIQRACDVAKNAGARLADDPPSHEDSENDRRPQGTHYQDDRLSEDARNREDRPLRGA
jgi:hypothetical protein